MIIQGDNHPLRLIFDEDMSNAQAISVKIYKKEDDDVKTLKKWSIRDLVINNEEVQAPLTQEETAGFDAGSVEIAVKWKDKDGDLVFENVLKEKVLSRYDREVFL